MRSISQAVLRISSRNISHWVCSSISGHWMAWLSLSGWPKGRRARAYLTLSSMQYTAAPRDEAAWRMRFWCTKLCPRRRPWPSTPHIASSGTQTSLIETRGWSVGMLKVQRYSSIFTPGSDAGTRNTVRPSLSPSFPEVRAKVMM